MPGKWTYLNGRIGQRVRVMDDGKILTIVDDSDPGPHRPYYEKAAVRTAALESSQLRRLRPPPPPLKAWPKSKRWAWTDGGEEAPAVEPALPHASSSS